MTTQDGLRRTTLATTLAWLVILAAAAYCVVRTATVTDPAAVLTAVERRARALVGARELSSSAASQVQTEVDALDTGPPAVRQRAAILAAEMLGAADAHRRLAASDAAARAEGGDVAERQRVLLGLYAAGGGETVAARVERLDAADRERIAAAGWLGRLALAPDGMTDPAPRAALLGAARRAALFTAAGGLAICVALLAGCAACVVLGVLFATRRLTLLHDASASVAGLGAETFAVWLVLHMGLGALLHAVLPLDRGWVGVAVSEFLTPAALLWPVVRGAPWAGVRRAYGLHGGGGVLKEVGCGIAGWFAALPFIAAGALASYLLIRAAGHGSVPPGLGAHPATAWAESASAGEFALLLVVACVAAPMLEETMFRGALYGHLRATTSSLPRLVSVAVGAAAVSMLFAAIHPQGWVGIPALFAIAMSLALAREWRGSLIAPMVMHGLLNALAFGMSRIGAG